MGRTKKLRPVIKVRRRQNGRIVQKRVDVLQALTHHNVRVPENLAASNAATSSTSVSDAHEDDDSGEGFQGDSSKRKRHYSYVLSMMANWTAARESLSTAVLCSVLPPSACVLCGETADKLYTCEDCGPDYAECEACEDKLHTHQFRPLHQRKLWNGGMYLPFPGGLPEISTAHTRQCSRPCREKLVIHDARGRWHEVLVLYCSCEPLALTLVKLKLWPSKPNEPKDAYHFDLLELLEILTLECHVATKGFTHAMKLLHTLTDYQASSLYRLLQNGALDEYKKAKETSLSKLRPPQLGLCPICPKKKTRLVSMDANFGLVRKQHSGISFEGPQNVDHLFISDDQTQAFMGEVNDSDRNLIQACSDFKAGNYIRANKSMAGLDITGVFGAVCRHEIPLRFLNMRHGERLGYPALLLKEMMADAPNDTNFQVTYDIACKFEGFMKNHHCDLSVLSRINFAVPVFHCYGHIASCQIKYNTRRLSGFGLVDGEAIERLWSYMRPFANATKQMTPSHRMDFLVKALRHYGERKTQKLGVCLVARMKHAKEQVKVCSSELMNLSVKYKVAINDELFAVLASHENLEFAAQTTSASTQGRSWKQQYIMDLLLLETLKEPSSSQEDRIQVEHRLHSIEMFRKMARWKRGEPDFETTRRSMEEQARVECVGKLLPQARDRHFLITLKRKYSVEGQDVANRLESQIKKTAAKTRKLVDVFNAKPFVDCKIDIVSAMRIESSLYDSMDTSSGPLPRTAQRQALNFFHLRERAREEQDQVKEDMTIFCDRLVEKHVWLVNCFTLRPQTDTDRAKNTMLSSTVSDLEELISTIINLFGPYLLHMPIIRHKFACQEMAAEAEAELMEEMFVNIESDGEIDDDDE